MVFAGVRCAAVVGALVTLIGIGSASAEVRIQRERICMTPNAVLGFHAAWMPGADGQPVRSNGGTRLLMAAYPPRVRDWIKRRGGLHSRTIFLRGRELSALYPPCS